MGGRPKSRNKTAFSHFSGVVLVNRPLHKNYTFRSSLNICSPLNFYQTRQSIIPFNILKTSYNEGVSNAQNLNEIIMERAL